MKAATIARGKSSFVQLHVIDGIGIKHAEETEQVRGIMHRTPSAK
jgi:hypothetical protein